MRILITGANGGLGRAVVDAFLKSGAEVFGVERSWTADAGSRAGFHPVAADLSAAGGCGSAVEAARPVDVLVHLLGGFAGGARVEDTEEEVFDRMIGMNLRSAFLMFRAVLPDMRRAGRGAILAVGARPGVEPVAGLGAYAASKAGLISLVRTVAVEGRAAGIRANAVLPGVIDTAANRAAMPGADFSRWVKPESIARLLVDLAGDGGADVSGAAIPVYGRS